MDPGTVVSAGGYWAAINRVVDNTYSSTAPSVIRTNVGGVIRTDPDGTPHYHQLLRLGNNTPWPFSDDELSILKRPCYDECFDALQYLIDNATTDCVFFLVSGSSGIGKTVEIYEMIARIVSNYLDTLGANAVPQPGDANRPTFGLRLRDSTSVLYFHYNEQAQPEVVEMKMTDITTENRPHYFFTDTVPEINSCAMIAQIHMTSKCSKHYSAAMKYVSRQMVNKLFFLPPFSLEEFLCCSGGHYVPVDPNQNQAADPHHWDHQERCQFLFDIFGGNVRFLKHYRSSSPYFLANDSEIISQVLVEFFDQALAANGQPVLTVYPELLQYCPKLLAYEWMTVRLERDKEIVQEQMTSMFLQFVPCGVQGGLNTIFASTFMSYVACALCSHDVLYQHPMWHLHGKDLARINYERRMHGKIMRIVSGTGLVVEGFGARNRPMQTIQFPPLPNGQPVGARKVFIRKWADIAGLKPFEYGFPTVSNFPLIDSIYRMPNNQGDIAFRMILAKRHLRSEVSNESHYFEQLNKAAHPVSLVYVLGHDNYGDFKSDSDLPATHWVQWRCCPDELTQNQKRKRRKILPALVVPAVPVDTSDGGGDGGISGGLSTSTM